MSAELIGHLVKCRSCKGSGTTDDEPCTRCEGTGYVIAGGCEVCAEVDEGDETMEAIG